MKHYPLFADLHQRPVLLVGGGHVAERKAEMLLQAGARLRVVAPALSPQLAAWQQAQKLEHIGSHFDAAQLAGVFLVVAATDSPTQNHTVFAAAEAAAKLCNCVDDVAHCSFIVPAVVGPQPLANRHIQRWCRSRAGAAMAPANRSLAATAYRRLGRTGRALAWPR